MSVSLFHFLSVCYRAAEDEFLCGWRIQGRVTGVKDEEDKRLV